MRRLLIALLLVLALAFPVAADGPRPIVPDTTDPTAWTVHPLRPNLKIPGTVAMGTSSLTAVTVATLPATPVAGQSAVISDGATAADCTVGGGAAAVECFYSGAAWVSKIGAAGAGDITSVLGTESGAVPFLYQGWTAFTAADVTPDVSAAQHFRTVDTTTITGFDHGAGAITDGRQLSVYCGAATVFDLTSSEITAANRSSDYTCVAGTVLQFVYNTDQWYALNIPDYINTLAKPAADRIVFFDFSADAHALLAPDDSTIEISGTTLRVKADGIDSDHYAAGSIDAEHLAANIAIDTTGIIAGKIAIIDGGAADLSLSAAQVSGRIISNTGQGVANRNHTLPTAASGLSFVGIVGEAQAANYYRFTRSGTDTVCLDGTCGKTYVSIAAPTQGAQVACYTVQMASTGMKAVAGLAIGTTNTAVSSDAFTFDIGGTGYAKAAVDAGTAPGDDVIPEGTFGAVAFDIGANGTIDAIEATANATGYGSAALAIDGLPAVEAAHTRMGTVTASSSSGAFTFGTTALSAANTTVAYTDTAVYTKPFVWQCGKGIGTWVTD